MLRVRNKSLPSAPIEDGATSLEWETALGTARLVFTSTGCEDQELALVAAHLAVLATKPSPAGKPVKAP